MRVSLSVACAGDIAQAGGPAVLQRLRHQAHHLGDAAHAVPADCGCLRAPAQAADPHRLHQVSEVLLDPQLEATCNSVQHEC